MKIFVYFASYCLAYCATIYLILGQRMSVGNPLLWSIILTLCIPLVDVEVLWKKSIPLNLRTTPNAPWIGVFGAGVGGGLLSALALYVMHLVFMLVVDIIRLEVHGSASEYLVASYIFGVGGTSIVFGHLLCKRVWIMLHLGMSRPMRQ